MHSCSYRGKNILFKTPKKLRTTEAVKVYTPSGKPLDTVYRHRIKPGDRVVIRFLQNYDLGQAAGQSATSTENIKMNSDGYLVNYDSTVTLPLLGRTNLIGLTRLEAAKNLEEAYKKWGVNDPIIDVNIVSLSVSVFGEVKMPGKITLDKENTTLVDVIAKAGGFMDSGKKNRIQIIRQNEVILVDMKDISAAYDPRTIIHDNDIVYVEPYGLKANMESISSTAPSLNVVFQMFQVILLSTNMYFILSRNF